MRGTLLAVLDIRQRFKLAASPLAPTDHLIIADAGPRTVALRVDRVLELVNVPSEDIQPAAETIPGAGLVAGIAKLPDGVLVIHDLDRFLSLDEGLATTAALAAAHA